MFASFLNTELYQKCPIYHTVFERANSWKNYNILFRKTRKAIFNVNNVEIVNPNVCRRLGYPPGTQRKIVAQSCTSAAQDWTIFSLDTRERRSSEDKHRILCPDIQNFIQKLLAENHCFLPWPPFLQLSDMMKIYALA